MFAKKKVPPLEGSSTANDKIEEIGLDKLSSEFLESLQKEDTSKYYSNAGIRMATIFGKEIDPSDKRALCGGGKEYGRRCSASSDTRTLLHPP